MPPPPPNPPLSYTSDPSIDPEYASVPVSTWIARENKNVCVGVAVLYASKESPPSHPPRILLIQRAACEAFPHFWEPPGGGAEIHEPDLLTAAARELYEETGLRAATFAALLGSYSWVDHDPKTGEVLRGKHGREGWRKISFIAEVEEPGGGGAGSGEGAPPEVTLDPEEHQAFVWATEEEVKEGRVGNICLDWISEEQKVDVLRAFEIEREKKERR